MGRRILISIILIKIVLGFKWPVVSWDIRIINDIKQRTPTQKNFNWYMEGRLNIYYWTKSPGGLLTQKRGGSEDMVLWLGFQGYNYFYKVWFLDGENRNVEDIKKMKTNYGQDSSDFIAWKWIYYSIFIYSFKNCYTYDAYNWNWLIFRAVWGSQQAQRFPHISCLYTRLTSLIMKSSH